MKIAILGTGNVGRALATGWLAAGHAVSFGSRQSGGEKARQLLADFADRVRIDESAAVVNEAQVAVLAVPWDAAEPVTKGIDNWDGKILIDATNPIGPGFTLAVGKTTSGGELVQSWAPGARVVKAFNTTGYNNMLDPVYHGESTTMFIAGDADDAKATVAQLAQELGFDVADVGDITKARYLEPLAMIWIHLSMTQGREIALKLIRRS